MPYKQEATGSSPVPPIDANPYNYRVCEKSFLCHSPRQILCYTYDYTFEPILEICWAIKQNSTIAPKSPDIAIDFSPKIPKTVVLNGFDADLYSNNG